MNTDTEAAKVPAVLQVTRPRELTCHECGAWLENAQSFSTCPHMHGKLRPWLEKESLRRIRDMRLLESLAAKFGQLPVAVRPDPKRKSYVLSDRGNMLFRRRREPIDRIQILRVLLRGRGVIARCDDAIESGVAIFTRVNKKLVSALAKESR